MKKTLNNAHDTFAKAHLTDIAVARDFLKAHLPKNIASRCNLQTLRIEPTSYIDEKLRHFTTDILYSLEIDGEKGFIYCLVEHQSTVDEMMAFRFWCYIAAILRQYADNKANQGKKLPIVVPLLFYTGSKSPYPASLALADCFTDPELAKEVITQPAKLIDLTTIRDEDIKGHGQVAMLELIMKHIWDRDILNLAYEILTVDRMYPNHNRKLPKIVLDYLVANGESKSVDQFLTLMQQSDNYRSDAMTIAEQLELRGEVRGIEKGKREGMQQGMQQGKREEAMLIARNMLAEGLDINTIKKVTGLSAEELAKINTKH